MDFFFGLPRTAAGHNDVLVFVDRLSKMVHLAPVSDKCTGSDCARLFVDEVFRLHGLPDSIVSDRDPRFTGDFWESLFQILGTMAQAQDVQKEQADKNGRKNTSVFKEGDYVLVSTKNLSSQAVSSLGSTKLLPRYIGPFKVLKKTGNSYRVD
jgi:hypothetical protein